jgi:hypothetical protein
MIMCRWRLHRVWELESASLNQEIARLAEALNKQNSRNRAAIAFRNLADHSRSLELMSRYETKFARAFIRAHRCLLELKAFDVPTWEDHVEQSVLTIDVIPDEDVVADEAPPEKNNYPPNEPEPDSNPVL